MLRYSYAPLLSGANNIRLLRLLPSINASASIHCQLIDYSLTNPPRASHLYEALSYVWGDASEVRLIHLDNTYLEVTANLYAALQQLRDPVFERILWVDAIGINQKDLKERAQQVSFMAKIYQYATRVVVWLGEEADGSNQAMDAIRAAADTMARRENRIMPYKKHTVSEEISALLRRSWFRRIWVLQEVAAAQSLSICCGSQEMTGQCFYRGIRAIIMSSNDTVADIEGQINSIIYLMNGAVHPSRNPSKFEYDSLNIRPLSELVDMFNCHEASDRRDKIYALLGMSTSDPRLSKLTPNYRRHWHSLFHDLIEYILGAQTGATVHTWDDYEMAVICGRGCVLAEVVGEGTSSQGNQSIEVRSSHFRRYDHDVGDIFGRSQEMSWSAVWELHSPAKPIRVGDLLFLLSGAEQPMVIRPQKDHFEVISLSCRPPQRVWWDFPGSNTDRQEIPWNTLFRAVQCFRRDFLLVWNWTSPIPEKYNTIVSRLFERSSQIPSSRMERFSLMARVYEDLESFRAFEFIVPLMAKRFQAGDSIGPQANAHFLALETIYDNWDCYIDLKREIVDLNYRRRQVLSFSDLESFYQDAGAIEPDVLHFFEILEKDESFLENLKNNLPDYGEQRYTALPDMLVLLEKLATIFKELQQNTSKSLQ